jgi:hypothetical protein
MLSNWLTYIDPQVFRLVNQPIFKPVNGGLTRQAGQSEI